MSNYQNDEIVVDSLTHPSLFDQRLTTIQSMLALDISYITNV